MKNSTDELHKHTDPGRRYPTAQLAISTLIRALHDYFFVPEERDDAGGWLFDEINEREDSNIYVTCRPLRVDVERLREWLRTGDHEAFKKKLSGTAGIEEIKQSRKLILELKKEYEYGRKIQPTVPAPQMGQGRPR